MDKLFQLFSRKKESLFILFAFYTLTHIWFINLPPKGNHLWRQCNTAAVARNFVEEDMNIFHPRVDRRGDTNGITGMQFPSFEYTVALLAQITGYFDGLNRWVAFLYFVMGMVYFYALLYLLFQDRMAAFCGTWAFTFSPILYYHSITALPDVLALSASIAGLYHFMQWNKTRIHTQLLFALFFSTLAGLTKLQYLAIGFPIAVFVIQGWRQKKYSATDFLLLAAFALVTLFLSLLWYVYAVHLIETSGLKDFGIEFRPVRSFWRGLKIIGPNLYSHLPEQLMSFPNLIPFFVAVFWWWKNKKNDMHTLWWIAVWMLGLIVYHIVELRQMDVHLYYMFPYLPLLFILITKGYSLLLHKKNFVLVLLILISLPIIAFAGTFHHFINEQKSIPRDFYDPVQRATLDATIPDDALTIVGPDRSGCIFHYFSHTKGWSYSNAYKVASWRLDDCIEKGARYLIWHKRLVVTPDVAQHIEKKMDYQGTDLDVYLIRHCK